MVVPNGVFSKFPRLVPTKTPKFRHRRICKKMLFSVASMCNLCNVHAMILAGMQQTPTDFAMGFPNTHEVEHGMPIPSTNCALHVSRSGPFWTSIPPSFAWSCGNSCSDSCVSSASAAQLSSHRFGTPFSMPHICAEAADS